VLAVAWAGLVLAAPWLGSGVLGAPGAWISAGSYCAGALLCHQQAARSFHLAGAQLPVCARCAGLYVSGALGVAIGWLGGSRRGRIRPEAWRVALAVSVAPTLLTVALEWWRPLGVPASWRAAAAVPAGLAGGLLLAEFAGFRGRLGGCDATRRSR
jgi:hypothetical protein